ncbi:DUF4832 domain-containing protein [Fibrobacterota bacterium]
MKRSAMVISGFLMAATSFLTAQGLLQLSYEESFDDFPNPERGWFRARELPNAGNFNIRGENKTLIYGRISADDFRDGPFPQDFLDRIQAGFDLARENGIKVNPRVAYNNGPEDGCEARYGCDAPLDIVMNHIEQLRPLWEQNMDVISVLDPGFIGGWGEWHTSSNGLNTPENEKAILFAILDALPQDRMVYVRYPALKRRVFGGSHDATEPILDSSVAFDGSNLSRVGHLNDCFLSSDIDVGTYQYGWSREQNLDYIGTESAFSPFGGETCAVHAMGECPNTLYEMEKLHINHLNHDYHGGVIGRWQDDGCYDEITLKMGYRYVLQDASLNSPVPPGGILDLNVNIANVGWGELFNPRDVEAVLRSPDGSLSAAVLGVDPRWWRGGTTAPINVRLKIPAQLAEGTYSLGLRLRDKSPSIADDIRYAIRFANADVWDEESGVNWLTNSLELSASAPGEANADFTAFELVDGSVPVQAGVFAGRGQIWSVKHAGTYLDISAAFPMSGDYACHIYTTGGRKVYQSKLPATREKIRGRHHARLAVPAFSPGLYLFRFQAKGKSFTTKFLVDVD